MKYIKRFILMIQFLTTIPIRARLEVDNEDFGKGLVFAPVVGLLLGGVLSCAAYVFHLFLPKQVTAILLLVVYMLLTGGLHLDGLGDTFDGLFSNRSRERMLEIMRDSRVGTNAVLAITSVLLLNAALLSSIDASVFLKAVLLMPVSGRIGSIIGAGLSKYARSGEGLGKTFIDYCGVRELLMGLIAGGIIFIAISGITGVILTAVSALSSIIFVRLFSSKIGGATGDILGAVCELNQTIFLFAILLLQ